MNTASRKLNESASASRLEIGRRLVFQQPQQFRSRHEKFAAKRTTGAQFSALDQSINAEVIDSEKIGGFLYGIGEPLLFGGLIDNRCAVRLHRAADRKRALPTTGAPTLERIICRNYLCW